MGVLFIKEHLLIYLLDVNDSFYITKIMAVCFSKCPTEFFTGKHKKTNCSKQSLKNLSTAQILLPMHSVIKTGLCGSKVTSADYL